MQNVFRAIACAAMWCGACWMVYEGWRQHEERERSGATRVMGAVLHQAVNPPRAPKTLPRLPLDDAEAKMQERLEQLMRELANEPPAAVGPRWSKSGQLSAPLGGGRYVPVLVWKDNESGREYFVHGPDVVITPVERSPTAEP